MQKNYTPGPWMVEGTHKSSINAGEHGHLAEAIVPTLVGTRFSEAVEVRTANAKLMAAAPDLVEAIIDMAESEAYNMHYRKGADHYEEFDADFHKECRQFAEDHWESRLASIPRAALTKAGVLTTITTD
ncbi:hypothetical protein LEM8419_03516 [Neolewinella maritima]|uniref:Uncharacterized protein n=1 Tax=Neolewinella maritima TaxID=1383882 RepID=A0ABM9B5L6_9BACT|nr:hypothetical protein [Neolewinella maritima]CAH1002644.1 hypothetical protein LEM8419_03516 [Neolewinella maritima]